MSFTATRRHGHIAPNAVADRARGPRLRSSSDVEALDGRGDLRKARREIVAVAREQPDAIPVAQVEDAKAVVLDFVNPTGPAGGSFTDFGRQSAMAESSRGNTERDMG